MVIATIYVLAVTSCAGVWVLLRLAAVAHELDSILERSAPTSPRSAPAGADRPSAPANQSPGNPA